eukprot:TRINITY_DN12186_c1_g2_i4.p1 TRINITY_DN12186_c1_g2~~TRINITY_DN12186_c1_g2_i4.p1  ORF type:complete len:471 (+),score=92.95 TRINITY_DN12186_c1_g2_i4:162-1574(+)
MAVPGTQSTAVDFALSQFDKTHFYFKKDQQLRLAADPLCAEQIEEIALRHKDAQTCQLTANDVHFSNLQVLQAEHILSNGLDWIRFLRLIKSLVSDTKSESFNLDVAVGTHEADTASFDDWKIEVTSAHLLPSIIQTLSRMQTLTVTLEVWPSTPTIVAAFLNGLIALVLQRNSSRDNLCIFHPPRWLSSFLHQNLYSLTLIKPTMCFHVDLKDAMAILAGIPSSVVFRQLCIPIEYYDLGDESTSKTLAGQITTAIAQHLAGSSSLDLTPSFPERERLDMTRPFEPCQYTCDLSSWLLPPIQSLKLDGEVDAAPPCAKLTCWQRSSPEHVSQVSGLDISAIAARTLFDAIAAAEFSSSVMRQLHVLADAVSVQDCLDYTALLTAYPNLVEYQVQDQQGNYFGYDVYQLVRPFKLSQYGYITVGCKQAADLSLALGLAGVELPPEVLSRVLAVVVDQERRRHYADVPEAE